MKKIITIGASSSKNSINKTLANYVGHSLHDVEVINVDISNFNNTPIFSVDREKAEGAPKEILDLNTLLKSVDGFVVSFAEHNSSYAAGYKNVLDWISRQGGKIFNEKPTLLLSTSPGGRGGSSVLASALATYGHMGANISGSFSLPSFFDNFTEAGVTNESLKTDLAKEISAFQNKL